MSDSAAVEDDTLKVSGRLYAAGKILPLDIGRQPATCRRRARSGGANVRRSPRARDEQRPSGHDPHAERADRPRPLGPMTVAANATTPQERVSPPEPGLRRAARSGLDVMLSDAVLEGDVVGRFLKPKTAGRTIVGLARHPRRAVRDAGRFGVELAHVAAGRSEASAAKGRSALRRAGVAGQLAATAGDAELPRRVRDRRSADLRRRPGLAHRAPGSVCGEQRA